MAGRDQGLYQKQRNASALPCLGLPCLALACLALLCFVFSIFPYENIAMSCRDRLGTNVPKENSPDNCPINGVFHTHTGGRHRYRVVLVAVLAAAGARFPVVADAQGAKKSLVSSGRPLYLLYWKNDHFPKTGSGQSISRENSPKKTTAAVFLLAVTTEARCRCRRPGSDAPGRERNQHCSDKTIN
jgi:hypothetical protein